MTLPFKSVYNEYAVAASSRRLHERNNLMAIRTFISPKAGSGAVNMRSADKIDPANIVGTINEGTRLEYVT